MRVTVRVEGKLVDVEVGDLRERPIVAVVDGERVEVWPEAMQENPAGATAPVGRGEETTGIAPARGRAEPQSGRAQVAPVVVPRASGRSVPAPIPGVVVSVAVKPGDLVSADQELCVVEAMKMKNVIRAARSGEIAAVAVSAGDHVKHGQLLFEYAE